MRLLKSIWRFLVSRTLWSLITLVIIAALIWLFGQLLSIGTFVPLETELAKIIAIGALVILWLLRALRREMRARAANAALAVEIIASEPSTPPDPSAESIAAVDSKFANILDRMKKSKVGGRKFLRDMPWYVFIGPPGTGKTTALRQSGLHFPFDLTDDLKGVGGTRNCDWFFTEEAVLIDTAGRYVEQKSAPELDAAEWRGFLDILKKHRGRRALNGVIATLSVQELLADETMLRAHGKEIRRRLNEIGATLEIRLPVYFLITKSDLMPGFEAFFGDLSTQGREQVWGLTLPPQGRLDGSTINTELKALQARLEARLPERIAEDLSPEARAAIFRFPSEIGRLSRPIRMISEAIFGETAYEDAPWLRGIYLTSATQEGSPIDRLVGQMATNFGLNAPQPVPRVHGETRSFFLRNFLSDLVFKEAGIGIFDPKAEERRRWIWRGSVAGAALTTALATLFFTFSFQRYSAAIEGQTQAFGVLQDQLANVASRQAPTSEPLDLNLALDAVGHAQTSVSLPRGSLLTSLGPTARGDLSEANQIVYDRALRNILEPRMVALLEATMWRHIHDPEFLLGALKSYQMLTGLAAYDSDYLIDWWNEILPGYAVTNPFPTPEASIHQTNALNRMALAPQKDMIESQEELVSRALTTVCTIPLSVRAYGTLMSLPDVAGIDDWIPAQDAGPNGNTVLTRVTDRTLRVGIDGGFTYKGFHEGVLPNVAAVAENAALDQFVFAGGCKENENISTAALEADILKLYYEDFTSNWDGLLRDIRLSPLDSLDTANRNLKDLSSEDSALNRLLTGIVRETYLNRPETSGTSGGSSKIIKAITKRAGKLGKVAKTAMKASKGGAGEAAPEPGTFVSTHFAELRSLVEEVNGQPARMIELTAALTELSNELKTVMATPDPDKTLLERGGLPRLTGTVTDIAATLPDPIDDWITSIATESNDLTRDAVIAEIGARWRADVLPFCKAATQGRYPFTPSSQIDVNTRDFSRLFAPGGLFDTFTNEILGPYVDTTQRPWAWRQDFGLAADSLGPFEQARRIRNAMFPAGSDPMIEFILEPFDLKGASRVVLNVDGQALNYFNGPTQPLKMTWPGPNASETVTLAFAPLDGSPDVTRREQGAWALLRLFGKGSLRATATPEQFALRLKAGSGIADYKLRAASVDNPFDLSMLSGMSCPAGFP